MAASQPAPGRRLVTQKRAAEYFACTDRTIRNMIRRGDLTGYRVGKRMVRVDLNELDALLRPIPTRQA
jgi:excisionase family DNA binding protein